MEEEEEREKKKGDLYLENTVHRAEGQREGGEEGLHNKDAVDDTLQTHHAPQRTDDTQRT